MIDDVESVIREVETVLWEAQNSGVDRHQVAESLDSIAEEVRDGYCQLPENRGEWWQDVHAEKPEDAGDISLHPSATNLSINLGIPEEDVEIRTDGDALLGDAGELHPFVTMVFAEYDAGVKVTLSEADAEALQSDLRGALQEARADVAKFGDSKEEADADD